VKVTNPRQPNDDLLGQTLEVARINTHAAFSIWLNAPAADWEAIKSGQKFCRPTRSLQTNEVEFVAHPSAFRPCSPALKFRPGDRVMEDSNSDHWLPEHRLDCLIRHGTFIDYRTMPGCGDHLYCLIRWDNEGEGYALESALTHSTIADPHPPSPPIYKQPALVPGVEPYEIPAYEADTPSAPPPPAAPEPTPPEPDRSVNIPCPLLSGFEPGVGEAFPEGIRVQFAGVPGTIEVDQSGIWIREDGAGRMLLNRGALKVLEKLPPRRKAQAKGKRRPASGWIETREGNKQRNTPSVSYYYCVEQKGNRTRKYIPAAKVAIIQQLVSVGEASPAENRHPVAEILEAL
jgi:hypothetical protein